MIIHFVVMIIPVPARIAVTSGTGTVLTTENRAPGQSQHKQYARTPQYDLIS